jgi:5-methylthioadenosine/S-adenosylhomocysteine deaminase
MRFTAQTHTQIDPHEILRMGTLAGAEALGRDTEVGSITPGKAANLVAVPLHEGFTGGANEVLEYVFSSDEPVSEVWFRGTQLQINSFQSPPLDGDGTK